MGSRTTREKAIISKEPAKVAVGISYYNDYECLKRCLRSLIVDKVLMPDYVILVDGKYRGYPDAGLESEDGSKALAVDFYERHQWQVMLARKANTHERAKRQFVVDLAAKVADFLLIMDADEFIAYPDTNWSGFRTELARIKQYYHHNVYGIRCVDLHQRGYAGYRPRLWFNPGEMEYMDNHYQFKRRDNRTNIEYIADSIQGLTIFHDHSCRSSQREELRKEYEFRLKSMEK